MSDPAALERRRLRDLALAKARRLTLAGKTREADRWRAFSVWLREQKKPLDLST